MSKRPRPGGGGAPAQATLLGWATGCKKRTTPTTSSASSAAGAGLRTPQGSSFALCPLCGKNQPLAWIQSHVDSCDSSTAKATAAPPASGAAVSVADDEDVVIPLSPDPVPMPGPAPAATIELLDESPPKPGKASSPPHPPAAAAAVTVLSPPPEAASAPPQPLKDPPKRAAPQPSPAPQPQRNAFDVLRKGVAQQFRREVFSLRATPEGQLDWEWTASSSAAAAAASLASPASQQEGGGVGGERWWCWEREVTLPGTKGGRLVLRTNLAPETLAAAGSSSAQQQQQRPHQLLPLPDVPISVLKSALQKDVRLSRGEAAARVALQLLHRAPAELWRRMLIIMFEDAILHPPGLVLFTWLLLAGEAYLIPGPLLRKAALRCVFEVGAGVRVTDFASRVHNPAMDPIRDDMLLAPDALAAELPVEYQTLVRCIVARRHFGGMSCDARMLRSLSKLWRLRLAATDAKPPAPTNPPVPAALLLPPRVRLEAPAPGWRPPAAKAGEAAAAAAGPLLQPLGYVAPQRLQASYLDSPCLWARWLAWHLLAHCPPLPQAWLPSLDPSPTAPAPEAHPAVWRLDPQRDIPLSAVDFHVSNVIDETLNTRLSMQERRALYAALRRAGLLAAAGGGPAVMGKVEEEEEDGDGSEEGRRRSGGGRGRQHEAAAAVDVDEVKACLRSAMWRFSSSVTDKTPVSGAAVQEEEGGSGDGDGLQLAWAIVEPHAHAYARAFIKRRCSVML